MLNVLLHDDWEIYGDGTGDPDVLMFEPAKRILDICDIYGARYTFYAEIGQQLNILNAPANSKWRKYARTWEDLLKDAIQRGHDVQLHFHPQWMGAELRNDIWQLDYTKWNTGKIEFELLDEWIGKGTAYLRNLLRSVKSDYDVVSYRAGGWMCQPSTNLYKALKKHGILCDVSVIKGRYKEFSDGGKIDFRYAHSNIEPWEVHPDDFAKKQKGSGLWELPVYSELSGLPHPVYLLSKCFRPLYYYNIYKKRRIQKGGGDYSPKTIRNSYKKDYYGSFGYMHYNHLLSFAKDVKKNRINRNEDSHLIFLTHSKGFLYFDNFEKLLDKLSSDENIRFTTTRNYVKNNLTI